MIDIFDPSIIPVKIKDEIIGHFEIDMSRINKNKRQYNYDQYIKYVNEPFYFMDYDPFISRQSLTIIKPPSFTIDIINCPIKINIYDMFSMFISSLPKYTLYKLPDIPKIKMIKNKKEISWEVL